MKKYNSIIIKRAVVASCLNLLVCPFAFDQNKPHWCCRYLFLAMVVSSLFFYLPAWSAETKPQEIRLAEEKLPTIGCWFMHEEDFQPEGYKPFLNMVAHHTSYNLLTTSIRAPKKQVTDQAVYDQVKKAATYAHRFGIGIVMDLDVRLARTAFYEKYPNEMQEMLRVREQPLSNNGKTTLTITSAAKLHDHYTSYTAPYLPLEGRFVKAYSYVRDTEGIVAQSIQELDQDSYLVTEAGPKQVTISFTLDTGGKNKCVCAIVSFTHLSPDVFAPHLLSFQREIIEKYADSGIVGVCKDEWGFPPCHDGNPDKNDHWYSKWFAKAYAQQTGGRDLQQDVFLMTFPIKGKEEERQAVINQYMRLCWKRNAAIECDCYNAVKTILGPQGVMATHPTWWPYPGIREIKKNGLHWWAARRDLAQVDEVTPFCVRTALAKKWGSPIWYNMYYSSKLTDYEASIWTHALGGGRVNFHPLFPTPEPPGWSQAILFRNQLMHGNCRIRLLNFITKSAVDCPVAVIFGHASATNWAGPGFNDVGMNVASSLWAEGYYADLIPTSEISSGSLRIDSQGWLCYGAQRYVAAVLYHPEFEGPETASFFQKAAKGSTELFGVGQWTKDFDGKPRDASWRLPESMKIATNANACVVEVIKFLQKKGTIRQEPAVGKVGWGEEVTAAPPTKGHIRLLDGTHVFVAGEKDVAGDPIRGNFFIDGHNITIDAIGVAAWRLDNRGKLSALAAGGLKDFRIDSFEIHLEQRVDLAFWQDEQGQMHGVLQNAKGLIPNALQKLTDSWHQLAIPSPLDDQRGFCLTESTLEFLALPNALRLAFNAIVLRTKDTMAIKYITGYTPNVNGVTTNYNQEAPLNEDLVAVTNYARR